MQCGNILKVGHGKYDTQIYSACQNCHMFQSLYVMSMEITYIHAYLDISMHSKG